MNPITSNRLMKMLWLAVPSIIIFTLMYLITTYPNELAFQNFMKNMFGYSERYDSFGPAWLVFITWDFGALAGYVVFSLIVGFVVCFLFVLGEKRLLLEFLCTIFGAVVLLLFFRFIFHPGNADMPSLLFNNAAGFPSGHAVISMVLYASLAKLTGGKLTHPGARLVVYFFAGLIIFLIGAARLFTSHYPSEVVAGWCAGVFWLSVVNYIFDRNLPPAIYK